MQRIWNEDELKKMELYEPSRFFYDETNDKYGCNHESRYIVRNMLGLPLEKAMECWCVEDWMIAKEPKLSGVNISYDDLIFTENGLQYKQNNMETKKVTLNNGTILEVGNTYIDNDNTIFEVLCIGNKEYFFRTDEGYEASYKIDYNEDIIPYTPPTPKKEWKTFLIEIAQFPVHVRSIYQFHSIEEAKEHFSSANVTITEVKINIEPVNS